jgi:hypothetical protein
LPTFPPPFLLPLLLVAAATSAMAQEPMPGVQLAQVTIEQRVIIRIPLVRPQTAARGASLPQPIPDAPQNASAVKEVKGPKCLKLDKLRGAVINAAAGTITMLTDKDERFRTHFGRMCRAADFYSGFYVQPNKDGSICVGRDTLHARNGSTCDIERFGKLVPDDDDD